jgi:tetratricopeptide (TPR) repeat protein
VTDRLLVDLGTDGRVSVSVWREGELPDLVGDPANLVLPLDGDALEDLRWYLEDYLRAPFGVYGDRGLQVADRLPSWGTRLFEAIFGGSGPARDAYVRARARGGSLEVVFRSGAAELLGLPWELMRDPDRPTPIALDQVAVTRSLPLAGLADTFTVGGSHLRVLMVISRPEGPNDVGYQMIARPLLHRLEAVRGSVDLVVLRPPTLEHLEETLAQAQAVGKPFQMVHFDGHGVFGNGRPTAGWGPPWTFQEASPRGMLAFEKPGGGADLVPAEKAARVLAVARVPVVVLNACQSGQLGGQVEAAVATRLLQEGAACVVAMAYSVYAVAAAEFMAAFYERLFAGDRVADAVSAGRRRLEQRDKRPSPKGKMPLADWMVPVFYTRREVRFPGLRTERTTELPPLDAMLDRLREHDRDEHDRSLAPDGAFVGRDGLMYTLEVAARLQKVVVLYGPGGTGKTELAKAFGRWWRDTGGIDVPGGVIWHSFEPGVASFGLDGVITSIGLRVYGADFARLDPGTRRRVVEELLTKRRLLLIWDNFESVNTMPDLTGATPPLEDRQRNELRNFLAHIATNGTSSIIITSRTQEKWLDDPHLRRIEVAGLSRDEAIDYADQLLEPIPHTRARRAKRAFGELMEWLDGHPLSMRLILPHLDSTDPQDLLDGLHGITPLPGDDEGGRTTSLPASITYSFDHLPATAQRALSAVSLFHGVAHADVLGAFSDHPDVPERFRGHTKDDWVRVLDHAAELGLLTKLGAGMYRVHPALPAYLVARWRVEEPDTYDHQNTTATRVLLDTHAVLGELLSAQFTGGDAQLAISYLELQRRTFCGLLGYALDNRLWHEADALARPLNDYWDIRGLYEEARGWVDRARIALEDPDDTPPNPETPAWGLWRYLVGCQANRQLLADHLDDAEHTYLEILHTLQNQPPTNQQRGDLSVAYHHLGVVAQERGRLEEAEQWYRRSLTISEDRGDLSGMATTYGQLGVLNQELWRLKKAEQWYRRSLTISKDRGDRPGMANTYHQLGGLALTRGRLKKAEQWYRRSLTIREGLGDRPGMANTYGQLGIVAQERGRLEEAEQWYRRSLTISENLGNQSVMATTYHQLGIVAQKRGRLEEAEQWYRRSLTIEEGLGDRPGMANTYGQLGLLAEKRGQLMEALEWTIRCVALFDQFPHPATGPGPSHLKRLTSELGFNTLEQCWPKVTDKPLPSAVHQFVHLDNPPGTDGQSE